MPIIFHAQEIRINQETMRVLAWLLTSLPEKEELKLAQQIRKESEIIFTKEVEYGIIDTYLFSLNQVLTEKLLESKKIGLPEITGITHTRSAQKIYDLYHLYLNMTVKCFYFFPYFEKAIDNSIFLIIEILNRLVCLALCKQTMFLEDSILLTTIDCFIEKISKDEILRKNKILSIFLRVHLGEHEKWSQLFFSVINKLKTGEEVDSRLFYIQSAMQFYSGKIIQKRIDNLLIKKIKEFLVTSTWSSLKKELLPTILELKNSALKKYQVKIINALLFSEQNPNFELVKELIADNPALLVDKSESNGKTVLEILIEKNNYEAIAWIIEKFSIILHYNSLEYLIEKLLVSRDELYLIYLSYLNLAASSCFSQDQYHKKICDLLINFIGKAQNSSEVEEIMRMIESEKNKCYFEFLYDPTVSIFLGSAYRLSLLENWENVKEAARITIQYFSLKNASSDMENKYIRVPEISPILINTSEVVNVLTTGTFFGEFIINITQSMSPIRQNLFIKKIIQSCKLKHNEFLLALIVKQFSLNLDELDLISPVRIRVNKFLLLSPEQQKEFIKYTSKFANGFNFLDYEDVLLAVAQIAARKMYSFRPTVLKIEEFKKYLTIIKEGNKQVHERFIIDCYDHWNCGEIKIEKDGTVNLLLIDSFGLADSLYGLSHLVSIVKEVYPSCMPYIAIEKRQHASLACGSFALNDLKQLHTLVNYLNHSLFKYLESSNKKLGTVGIKYGFTLFKVKACLLPISLLRTTQSLKSLSKFLYARSDEEKKLLITKTKKNVIDSIIEHLVVIKDEKGVPQKIMNMRLNKKLEQMSRDVADFLLDNSEAKVAKSVASFTLDAFIVRQTSTGIPLIPQERIQVEATSPVRFLPPQIRSNNSSQYSQLLI